MSQQELQKDFLKFWNHISLRTIDETLIVLKGHLLLEDLMREYCASRVQHEKYLEEAKLSFLQLTHLVKAFHKYQPPEWVWAALKKVNGLRNKLAHKLIPIDYEKSRDEFIDFVKKASKSETDMFSVFTHKIEQLAMAIFIAHTALSVSLRFEPKGLLSLNLLLDEAKNDDAVS